MTLLIFLVLGVVFFAGDAGPQRRGFRWLRRRPEDEPSDPWRGRSFRGGGRIGGVHGTWPFVQLWFDRDCAVIRIGAAACTAMPRWRVVEVQVVGTRRSSDIRFVGSAGEFDRSVFSTFEAATIIASLRAWGWPVPD